MDIPKFQDFLMPVLENVRDEKPHRTGDVIRRLRDASGLTDEALFERLDSGAVKFDNRVYWAITYLRKGKALSTPQYGYVQLTEWGRKLLGESSPVTLERLNQFPKGGEREEEEEKRVDSIDEYLEEVRVLTEDPSENSTNWIFRGEADSTWNKDLLKSSALCRLGEMSSYSEDDFMRYHDELINEAHRNGYGYDEHEGSRRLHFLEVLAKLQHCGAATAFIDFTRNTYVALWFAVRSHEEKDGKVFVISIGGNNANKFESIKEETFSGKDENEEEEIEKYLKMRHVSPVGTEESTYIKNQKYGLWEPRRIRNQRAVRQDSIFVFGQPAIDEVDYKYIIIKNSAKAKIKGQLERLCNFSEETMFPDLHGFANANNRFKLYISGKEYWQYSKDGDKYYQSGDYERAIKSYSKAIISAPNHSETYVSRGRVYYSRGKEGDFAKGVKDFEKAIDLGVESPSIAYSAYYGLGICCFLQRKFCKAAKAFESAIKYPELADANIYNTLGLCYTIKEKFSKAIICFTKSIERDPNFYLAYYHRAKAKRSVGDCSDKGCQDLQKALELVQQQGDSDFEKTIRETMNEWGDRD